MEEFDLSLGKLGKPDFDAAPPRVRCRIAGVDYLHLKGRQGGEMFITRAGWPVASCIAPERWFTGNQFRKPGQALAGATGAVYRVPVQHPARNPFALVVKFSRFGQEVGLAVVDQGMRDDAPFMAQVDHAEFLPPFEEFGHLMKLRNQCRGRMATMAPLAIYSPPTRYLAWQLGRKPYLNDTYALQLQQSQHDVPPEQQVRYDWERIYILLYQWLGGVDAEQAYTTGMISHTQMVDWTKLAAEELRGKGWMVLDHKARHLILRRQRHANTPVLRHGKPIMGLVDYELLCPTPPQQR